MTIGATVSFRDMYPSDALDAYARRRADKLARFFDGIVSCRIVIEAPERRRRHGPRFHVRIELAVPGHDIVVSRDPANLARADAHACIDDAFDDAERCLQDYARRRRGEAKSHSPTARGYAPVD